MSSRRLMKSTTSLANISDLPPAGMAPAQRAVLMSPHTNHTVNRLVTSDQTSGPSEKYAEALSYPSGVGKKFHINGSVRAFPGNTIICHLDQASELSGALLALYETLRAHRLSHLYSLLPPSSWHMTVFEGVVDAVRTSGHWPSDLAADAPLRECDESFEQKLAEFDLQLDPPFNLRISGWQPLVDGIGLRLEPSTPSEENNLRGLRDRLSDALKIRHPEHDSYVFHLSIAYLIRHPSPAQRNGLQDLLDAALERMPAAFRLGAPEFCRFDDMFEFRRLFYLERHA